ncbi:MAG: S9 family peptidase [Deltaproteobacteria bacterium]|nr:MAG: S9 family peptidase [Deltaproteobacteria bacterium]
MKKLATLLGLSLLLAACAGPGAGLPATGADSTLPPLVDRQLFFGDPEISGAQLSPDGRYLSFIKPYQGARNIWVKEREQPFDQARPVTADKRPVPGYFWSRDSRYLLYVQDKGGNENFHVYAVDPRAAPDKQSGVPPARDLTPVKGVRAYIYSVPKNRPGEIIVGLNDRDPAYHDVYRVDIASGKRTLLITNTHQLAGFVFDLEGNPRLAFRQTEDAGWEILRLDGDRLTRIYDCNWQETCYPYRFHRDGRRCYLITNKGPDVDLIGLALIDVQSGKVERVESDPEGQVDFGGAVFSEDSDELIATYYQGDRQRVYPRDDRFARDLENLRRQLPDGELGLASMTRDMRYFIVGLSRDVDPGSAYLYDRESGRATLIYRSRPQLDPRVLAPMKPVRYQARDGLTIPAYLTLPRGLPARGLPAVVLPHGGPWARDSWGYDAYAQFLANRGYAVLQPNFRGSTGYGKKFLNAGNRQWGTGAMQHDISDGVKWLVDQGIADPRKVCIFGGSYGGYATLAGVTFTPELYACGVAYVAPSNLITLLESIPPYWKPLVKMFTKRVGDPQVEADRKDMEARSPLFFVERITAPLLVVHGANDPRVKRAEADSIVAVLRDKKLPVEYLVAPDEGHGFRAPENRLALAVAMERFLARHLGGRVQQQVRPKIAQRLAAITVDPATVKMPDKQQQALAEQAGKERLPEVSAEGLAPATLKYRARAHMAGRKLEMLVTRTLERRRREKLLSIISQVEAAGQTRTDSCLLAAATLLPVERTMGKNVTLKFSGTRVTGKLSMGSMGGQTLPIDTDLGAPAFGDGPALEAVLADLPLEDHYQTTLRVFDLLTQKARPMKLTVEGGKEKVEVGAGRFDTFKVKLEPLDGQPGGGELFLRGQAPHWVVKGTWNLPAMMGGGTLEVELLNLQAGSK